MSDAAHGAGPELTVVVLAFDEERDLDFVVRELVGVLADSGHDYEVIVVDDGSTDRTGEVADGLAGELDHVRVIHHERNLGMGAGLRSGFAAASGTWLSFLPADGQIDPRDVVRMLEVARREPGVGLVLNHYERRDDGLKRKVLSKGLRLLTWALTGARWRNEGPYLIAADLARRFSPMSDTFFFNLELVILCERAGVKASAITSRTRPRRSGASKVASRRKIWAVAKELWRMRRG